MSSAINKTVILFTRIPHAGTTKTRLMPFLTPEECVNLHYSFMGDEIAEICKVADKLVVSYFEDECITDDDRDDFRSFLIEEVNIPFCTTVQRGSDIFKRMKNSFIDCENECNLRPKLLVGCDLPDLVAEDLCHAFQKLQNSDIVLNPTVDGGYWLVGMNKLKSQIFDVAGEGGNSVMSDTLHACCKHGLSVNIGRKLEDIDTPKDLHKLYDRRQLLQQGSLTKTFLESLDKSRFEDAELGAEKLSIIVPTYNEESTIESFIFNLDDVSNNVEIIFVDGGSTDKTIEILQEKLPKNSCIIQSHKGRAHQMNEGAKVAKGDIFMFLHADCTPPKNFVSEIRRVLASANWGCFGVKFDEKDPLMKICQIISNNRIRDRKVVFGDQGIFIKRKLFEEIGGFPEIPIMEDYQLSLTLKEKQEKIGVGKGLVTTSARRFHEGGKLKVMWKMNRLRKAYRDGVPIEEISRQYRDIR